VRMWAHPATQRTLATLRGDGVFLVGPVDGDMACGEYGPGRMSEPLEIVEAVAHHFTKGPLKGRRILVTSGPTHEPIDPVRFIANRSSGAQGTALAQALRDRGAEVVFVTGPASVAPPEGVEVVKVETAQQMLEAVQGALPADAAVFAAAVADWRVASASDRKLKKSRDGMPTLIFAENPDILREVSRMTTGRPALVVGFAAETDDVVGNATAKRARKGCDWIVANDVSPETGIMGGQENAVVLIDEKGADNWPRMSKSDVAERLADRIAEHLGPAGT
jgi:phosphopantothenoylcysteine decarboxylase / phosphopantothenate---cysteine ligase